MARLKAYQLERRATQARARETYMATPRPPAPYKQSGSTQKMIYPALIGEDTFWEVDVRIASANLLIGTTATETKLATAGAAQLGLYLSGDAAVVTTPQKIRGTGQRPAGLQWFFTDDQPVTKTTPWQTTSVSFAKKTGTGREEQSHRSCPIGDNTGTPTYAGVRTVIASILTEAKKTQLTGTSRGAITFMPEIGKITFD